MVSTHDLVRLIYCSQARVPTDNLLALSAILSVASRNNARDGITGLLAVSGGDFIQVVEGPADRVRALMARIAGDPRHADIVVLDEQRVSGRLFSDWAMAAPRITPELTQAIDQAVETCRGTPAATIDRLSRIVEARSRTGLER